MMINTVTDQPMLTSSLKHVTGLAQFLYLGIYIACISFINLQLFENNWIQVSNMIKNIFKEYSILQ